MTPACSHRETCRLCDSSRVEVAVPIRPSPIADAYVPSERLGEVQELFPLDLYLCRDCGHVQLLDVVNPDTLFRDYLYTTSVSLGLVEHFRRSVAEMVEHFPAPPHSLALDIGSNDGTVLRFFKERGLRVLGVDPALGIARKATDAGIETLPAFFTSALGRQIRVTHGPASIVTANNVFAHADTLADMADGIREVLAPDGVFVFEVSYLVDIIDRLLFDTVYHEHLCYHSVRPFDLFFRRHGLELIDVQRLPTKGGSIRGFVQRRGGPHRVTPAVAELLALEVGMGLGQPEIFARYSRRIDGLREELLALVRQLKAGGGPLAGFGASATVTTLTYHMELGPYLDFLVDDNASRHGLFSPGYHLPVLDPVALRERGCHHAVILAWQYAEPILKKHRGYLDSGGHFIVPLPVLRVVSA